MQFNCPKNFKQGRLIANRFRWSDLIIAGSGMTCSIFMVLFYINTMKGSSAYIILGLLAPALICCCLVCPTGLYHNLLEFLSVMMGTAMMTRLYVWGGIYKYDSKEKLSTDVED